tara:strand:+ start:2147 stop:2887 length:741 start_codon:yes stop_codon:yes gene_type:complete
MGETSFTRHDQFPETRWTLIRRATDANPEQMRLALEEFCRTYWFPLYCYARRRGHSVHDAQDTIQSFFVHLLDQTEKFRHLDANHGKLRSWLLTSLRNFLSNERKRSLAAKRGGSVPILAIDIDLAEERLGTWNPVADATTAEHDFDRLWAETVLRLARQKLRTTFETAGKGREYEILKPFLTKGTPEGLIPEAAAKLEKTEGAVRMAILRLRDDYRVAIQCEIADTLDVDDDVEEEVRYLISCLG